MNFNGKIAFIIVNCTTYELEVGAQQMVNYTLYANLIYQKKNCDTSRTILYEDTRLQVPSSDENF